MAEKMTISTDPKQFQLELNSGFTTNADGKGSLSKTLKTANKYVDKDILIDVEVPKAVYKAATGGATTADITKTDTKNIITTSTTNYPITIKADAAVTAGSMEVQTPGWTNQTIDISAGEGSKEETFYIKESNIANTATTGVTYADDNTVANIADGYIYIEEGYTPATKISLATILPELDVDATSESILQGEKAYDEDGKVITGTMPNSNVPDNTTIAVEVGTIAVNGDATTTVGADSVTVTVPVKASATASREVSKGYVTATTTLAGDDAQENNVEITLAKSTSTNTLGTATATNATVNVAMTNAATGTGIDTSGILATAPATGDYITITGTATEDTKGSFSNTVKNEVSKGFTDGSEETTTVSGNVGVTTNDNAAYIAVYDGTFE